MANNNDNKVLNVPPLRFPEFSGEWKMCTIGELITKVGSGVTPRGGEAVYKTEGHPFVRSQNVGLGNLLLDDIAFIDEETHLRQKNTELQFNDVLLNITGASIGRSALVDKQIVGGNVNQHVCIIRTKENLVPSFICSFLLSNYGQRQIDSFQAGGNRQGLNFEQIKSIKITIPSKDEQIKIAKLLRAIDERIATQNKIIDKLQSLIKGLRVCCMQRNGSNNVYLSEIAQIYQPQTISSAELTEDGFLVYGANGIIGKYKDYNHKTEQICITCRGNTCGMVNYTKPMSWITGNAMVINTDKYQDKVYKKYLYHYLSAYNFNSIISGSGQPQIVRTPLEKLKITLPTISEQKQKAMILDKVQDKIEINHNILNLYILQKQYLLRQMFI
ncbi:restriction endonuclease subunit S [Parabacteroides merdae]|uniref:restriction endonuclease subunit S n=3 Tax=Bacteria TaxID=2 RepID=UPI001D06E7B2|nr:restriction endonuclease subunit S [Parabacteroides merdae]MCB6307047.1 restriction endonuclease subunit S [Parabacteroides merdae]MCI6569573.1 restriction endonuclease subunit S [Parabacteroides merdae]MDB8902424.1 restriction endonuclease subunit S [Parabacteroides merdae]MDB8905640.1 restriction endonuclease subunit S [Parabacteroides merdae]MDY5427031.1 restriction endonuclease subunit S [Parabacteroides merdae]